MFALHSSGGTPPFSEKITHQNPSQQIYFHPPHKSYIPNYCYLKWDISVSKLKKVIKIFNNKMSQFFWGILKNFLPVLQSAYNL